MSTTVTSKGQVTIPKPVREYLGIEPGSQVEFSIGEDRNIVIKRADGERPLSRFDQARGHAKTTMTTDEIMSLMRGDD